MSATTITHSTGIALTTDVTFRAWGSPISAAIGTAGWTQTSDTGQINWTTVTIPTAGAPSAAYEVWRLNDSLQATDPIFIKVMYGRSTNNGPAMRIIAGTASDGAGTITSAANTNVSVTTVADIFDATSATMNATPCKSYVNGDGSTLVMLLSPNQSSATVNGGYFHIERRRAADGTAAAGGFAMTVLPGNQGVTATKYQCVYTNNIYSQPASSALKGYALIGRQAASGSDNAVRNNVVPVYPVCTGSYLEFGAPSKYVLAVYRGDVPLGQTFQVAHYGSTQTFLSVGALFLSSASTSFDSNGLERVVPAVRID